MASDKTTTEPEGDAIALAALQSQVTDLRRDLELLRQAPAVSAAGAELEDGILAADDLFRQLRPACWMQDHRVLLEPLTAAAAVIRARRAAALKGQSNAA